MKTKKQIIFEEAARLFRDKGYNAASMRDLADRVGLERASSLYSHIRSKEEILQKICMDNALKFVEGIKKVEEEEQGAREKIIALIRLHIKIATEDMTSVTVFNDEWRHLSSPHLEEFLSLRHDYEQRFLAIIEVGITSGDFKSMDSKVALYSILSSVRWIHYWYKPGRDLDTAEIEANLIKLLTSGLLNEGN